MLEAGNCVKRETVAQDVLNHAGRLSNMADELAARMLDQLAPVMVSPRPEPVCGTQSEKVCISKEHPPLFDDLRSRLLNIEQCFRRMTDGLNRTEI